MCNVEAQCQRLKILSHRCQVFIGSQTLRLAFLDIGIWHQKKINFSNIEKDLRIFVSATNVPKFGYPARCSVAFFQQSLPIFQRLPPDKTTWGKCVFVLFFLFQAHEISFCLRLLWISGEGEGDGPQGVQEGHTEGPRRLPHGPGCPRMLMHLAVDWLLTSAASWQPSSLFAKRLSQSLLPKWQKADF